MKTHPGALRSGLVPIDVGGRRWPLYINGELVDRDVRSLVIDAMIDPTRPDETHLGRLEYGAQVDADGKATRLNTWIWVERGGPVLTPFAVIHQRLYIAVVRQQRFPDRHLIHNPTGVVTGLARGFRDPEQTMDEASIRELYSEVGVFTNDLPFRLGSVPGNAFNAWVQYMDLADGNMGGTFPYGIGVAPASLSRTPGGLYRFRSGAIRSKEKGSPGELIEDALFLPWDVAVRLRDQYTGWAIAHLLAHLYEQGRMRMSFRGR